MSIGLSGEVVKSSMVQGRVACKPCRERPYFLRVEKTLAFCLSHSLVAAPGHLLLVVLRLVTWIDHPVGLIGR